MYYIISPDNVTISTFNSTYDEHTMMKIDLIEKPNLDIAEMDSENVRNNITKLMPDYKPAKTKTANIEKRKRYGRKPDVNQQLLNNGMIK